MKNVYMVYDILLYGNTLLANIYINILIYMFNIFIFKIFDLNLNL